ncbi:MAG: cysteine dioxygenase [Acidimicrobiia bacterium]|nr:cysteine dioxygenase [Acidimicrobiia bacterium]
MIDGAVRLGGVHDTVERLKLDLSHAIQQGRLELGERFHQTLPDRYARRLLCRNEELGYTAVVMTWGPGQRTPVHDHAGMWCVEGVVEGLMDVHQYDLLEQQGDRYRFEPTGLIHAQVGSAGCLIPPFEYHVLANASDAPSITLHIYGGEMDHCNVYLPREDGWYSRQPRQLNYD